MVIMNFSSYLEIQHLIRFQFAWNMAMKLIIE